MRSGRSLAVLVLSGAMVVLPMCGSEDPKRKLTADGGEAGQSSAGAPGTGGSAVPSPLAGAAGEQPAGGLGGGAGSPSNAGGVPGEGGEASLAGAAGVPGAAGAPAFCAVDQTSCCGPEEASCDDWPGLCGQSMDSYSCCEAGQRQTCDVQYFDGNYHVVYGKQECECAGGSCDCACVKGDGCSVQEADCNNTSWSDLCVLGNSPTCCDSANGIRQRCVFNGTKDFTNSVVIDDCTGEGFGTASCGNCLNPQDPPCDDAFFNACGDSVSYCSDSNVGYRQSCLDGKAWVECTCDPSTISG